MTLLTSNKLCESLRLDWESFCSYQNSDLKDGKLQCSCGETYDIFKWQWEQQAGNLHVLCHDDREILFHPIYSSGTAAMRGNDVLKSNMHYYWEIKILTKLYGTDVMIGVGTSKITLNERQYKFCSMLGFDDQSWGYSYRGIIQHDKMIRKYGSVFGLGSIIGVHLDMCTGTLEYFLNRKSLGIAFRGLKNRELYPMVCSTAAQSSMRLTCSLSLDSTLQMKCLMVIKKHPRLIRLYHSIPGLSRLIKTEYFWLLPPKLEDLEEKIDLTFEDEAVLPLSTIVGINTTARHRKRMRTNKWSLYEPRADPDHVSYRDFMRKMANSSRSNKNENNCKGCNIHRPSRPRSPSPAVVNDKENIENLIGDIEDNFQEAIRNLSSTIDSMREVSDSTASTSMIYEDIDVDGDTAMKSVEEDLNLNLGGIEVEHFDGLRCNLSDCCDNEF
ncbi:SPRY domain [Popillia japonica]|uniref:SPRY domain n=1 Tax=Popillia japonica TaxID=7064 RepID=A0AAW1LVS9_POPJA